MRETRNSKFQQTLSIGPHRLLADEPVAAGGEDTGPGPYDFLLAGLGACTSMTMRLYADRKSLPLERVTVTLKHSKIHAKDCAECETREGMLDQIDRVIGMEGDARCRAAQAADGDRRQVPGAPHPHLRDPHRDPRGRLTKALAGVSLAPKRFERSGSVRVSAPMPSRWRRIDPKTIFTPAEWGRLTSRSSLRGMWLVAHAWGTILAAIALVTLWPNPLTWLIAVMVVGARQLGLAILMHEAAHGGIHANKAINEWVGQWLCAVPVGADLASYRSYHLQHHKFTQQPEDPDLSLSAPFPITKESYTRKAIRDLTGQTFVKQRLPLFAVAVQAQ